MKKNSLWTMIGFSIFGIIDIITFALVSPHISIDVTWQSYFLLAFYLVLIWVPFFISKIFKVNFNFPLVLAYEIFVVMALVAGSIWRVYDLPVYLDKIVHTACGILFAMICYNLYVDKCKSNLDKFWLFVLLFSFAMMIGGVWEILEYVFDGLTKGDAQKSIGLMSREALKDTMLDLICDFVGSIAGAIIALVLNSKTEKSQEKKIEN